MGDNAHVKGRHYANLNLSISSYVNLDYLLPPSVDKRENADKLKGAPSIIYT